MPVENSQSPELLCAWQDSWRNQLERLAGGFIGASFLAFWIISDGGVRAVVYPAAIAVVVAFTLVFPRVAAPASFRLCATELPDGRARVTLHKGASDTLSYEFALPARALGRESGSDGEWSLSVRVISAHDPPIKLHDIPWFLSRQAQESLDAWLLSRSEVLPLRHMQSVRPPGGVATNASSANGNDEILFVARAPRCPWIILLATVLGVTNMFLQTQYTPWITPTTSLLTLAGLVVVSIWIAKALRVAVVVKGRRPSGGVVELRVRRAGIALPAVRISLPARAELYLAETNFPKFFVQNQRGDQCRLRGIPETHLATVWSIVDRWLIEHNSKRDDGSAGQQEFRATDSPGTGGEAVPLDPR
jgi:hypothetical protein